MNKEFWNDRYRAEKYAYGVEPNVFFAEWLRDQPPGRLLLPCDGEGRNAVYAASLGWKVMATDHSEAGYMKAMSLAQLKGVSIDFIVEDVLKSRWPADHFDVVGLFYVHFPSPHREMIHRACISALKPGGTLILEAFAKEQIGKVSGGPRKEPILYAMDDLRADFASLALDMLESVDVALDEGIYHQGLASVVRLIAHKTL